MGRGYDQKVPQDRSTTPDTETDTCSARSTDIISPTNKAIVSIVIDDNELNADAEAKETKQRKYPGKRMGLCLEETETAMGKPTKSYRRGRALKTGP